MLILYLSLYFVVDIFWLLFGLLFWKGGGIKNIDLKVG